MATSKATRKTTAARPKKKQQPKKVRHFNKALPKPKQHKRTITEKQAAETKKRVAKQKESSKKKMEQRFDVELTGGEKFWIEHRLHKLGAAKNRNEKEMLKKIADLKPKRVSK